MKGTLERILNSFFKLSSLAVLMTSMPEAGLAYVQGNLQIKPTQAETEKIKEESKGNKGRSREEKERSKKGELGPVCNTNQKVRKGNYEFDMSKYSCLSPKAAERLDLPKGLSWWEYTDNREKACPGSELCYLVEGIPKEKINCVREGKYYSESDKKCYPILYSRFEFCNPSQGDCPSVLYIKGFTEEGEEGVIEIIKKIRKKKIKKTRKRKGEKIKEKRKKENLRKKVKEKGKEKKEVKEYQPSIGKLIIEEDRKSVDSRNQGEYRGNVFEVEETITLFPGVYRVTSSENLDKKKDNDDWVLILTQEEFGEKIKNLNDVPSFLKGELEKRSSGGYLDTDLLFEFKEGEKYTLLVVDEKTPSINKRYEITVGRKLVSKPEQKGKEREGEVFVYGGLSGNKEKIIPITGFGYRHHFSDQSLVFFYIGGGYALRSKKEKKISEPSQEKELLGDNTTYKISREKTVSESKEEGSLEGRIGFEQKVSKVISLGVSGGLQVNWEAIKERREKEISLERNGNVLGEPKSLTQEKPSSRYTFDPFIGANLSIQIPTTSLSIVPWCKYSLKEGEIVYGGQIEVSF